MSAIKTIPKHYPCTLATLSSASTLQNACSVGFVVLKHNKKFCTGSTTDMGNGVSYNVDLETGSPNLYIFGDPVS